MKCSTTQRTTATAIGLARLTGARGRGRSTASSGASTYGHACKLGTVVYYDAAHAATCSEKRAWRLISRATRAPAWYEQPTPDNMIQVQGPRRFLNALAGAGDRLVVIDFFAPWCRGCRALFPKIITMAEDQPELLFLAVNYDANKLLAHELGVKVLPYFLLYRGITGKIAGFSASLSKIQMLRDAIQHHMNPPCEVDYTPREVVPGDAVSIGVELGLAKCLSMLDDVAL